MTVALLASNYYCSSISRMWGIAVYITHEVSDFFLAVSTSLNYAGHPAQGPALALCIIVRICLRHCVNLRILWSMLPGGEFSTGGPYELDWAAGQYKCPLANCLAFELLGRLRSLNTFWLWCLLRSAYRLAVLGIAKDDRSEAEEEREDKPQVHPRQDNEEHVRDMLRESGEMVSQARNGIGRILGVVRRRKELM